MTNKLIVYGDSFAGPPIRFEGDSYSWVDLLSKKLNIRTINNSVAGSSLQFSIRKFMNDYSSNFIENNDIIIFVKTDPCRLHLKYQNDYPKTATQFLDRYFQITGTFPDNNWFFDNKKYIQWHEKNKDDELLRINSSSYIHMFYNYASHNKNILFILLDSFYNKTYIPLVNNIDNFIYPEINLFEASNLEFTNFNYEDWTYHVKSDPRSNHFSNINLENLANSIYKVIKHKDISYISYDSFERNIFESPLSNIKIYEKYINQNLLFRSKKHISMLKNK